MKTLERMGYDQTMVEVYTDNVPSMVNMVREKVYLLEKMVRGGYYLDGFKFNIYFPLLPRYKKRDDAFFIIDLPEIYRRYQQWKELMPRVEPFYALKCNNDPGVARFIADLGMGFDCASKVEIEQILDLGVDPNLIVFANPCKPVTHLEYAVSNGVNLMTFDDALELDKIKENAPNARLILRIFSSKEFKAFHNFNKKFGCHPDQAKQLLQKAKDLDMNVIGVSFHVGSLPEEVACFASAIEDAHNVFTVAKELGFDMDVLDIGGGYPGVDEDSIPFKEVAAAVSSALDQFFPAESGVRIIAEPGRYFVSAAFTLAVNIIAKRVVDKDKNDSDQALTPVVGPQDIVTDTPKKESDDGDKLHMYYVNDGIYGAFNNVFTDHATVYPMLLTPQPESRWSCMWGPTCDGLDSIMSECHLPLMGVGQWIYFHNMGAYTVSLSCNFNGIPRPMRYFVCHEDIWNIVYGKAGSHIQRLSPTTEMEELTLSDSSDSDSKIDIWKKERFFNERLSLNKGAF